MFYVEEKGSRHAMMAVEYPTQDRAEEAARRASLGDCARALVWDCTDSPRGTLRATYANGAKLEQCGGHWLTACGKPKGHGDGCHPLGH